MPIPSKTCLANYSFKVLQNLLHLFRQKHTETHTLRPLGDAHIFHIFMGDSELRSRKFGRLRTVYTSAQHCLVMEARILDEPDSAKPGTAE